MAKLFIYGTLKDKDRQLDLIGRELLLATYSIEGYNLSQSLIDGETYPNIIKSKNGKVDGYITSLSEKELELFDEYENPYHRITISDGLQSFWIYLYQEITEARSHWDAEYDYEYDYEDTELNLLKFVRSRNLEGEFRDWVEEKRRDAFSKRMERELPLLKERMIDDFNQWKWDRSRFRYREKLTSQAQDGKSFINYYFNNGAIFTASDSKVKMEIGFTDSRGEKVGVNISGLWRSTFINFMNQIIIEYNQIVNSPNVNAQKKNTNHPKRRIYDELKDKIKQRESQLRNMSSGRDKDILNNELDNYRKITDRMKLDYQFENLKGFKGFQNEETP